MDTVSNFRTIEELVKMLDREKCLLSDMFERRKSMSYRHDFALDIIDYKRERLQFLIDHGVIHEQGDFLELEDVYVHFFEEVLDMNEEICVASVREYIESLKENINYYLEENNERRKYLYQLNVRKILRKIGLRTIRNVVDLKRNVDVTYKQEPNYKIKKARLVNLDEKRKSINALMQECERLIDHEVSFFRLANTIEMQRICMDVRNDFTDAGHNLLEIERQIIEYINQIEQQSLLFKKIRRIKYLKDQLTWREESNIVQVMERTNPLWMEKRPYNRFFLSLEMLRNNEEAYTLIRKVANKSNIRRLGRTEAAPIDKEFLIGTTVDVSNLNVAEMWNAFKAQGLDLFSFVRNYPYHQKRSLSEHAILFCQLATGHSDELNFTDDYETFQNFEYALIYAN